METLDSPDVFKNTTPQPHPPGTARSSAGIRSNMNTPRSGAVFLTEPDLKPYNRPKTAPAGKGVVPPLALPGMRTPRTPRTPGSARGTTHRRYTILPDGSTAEMPPVGSMNPYHDVPFGLSGTASNTPRFQDFNITLPRWVDKNVTEQKSHLKMYYSDMLAAPPIQPPVKDDVGGIEYEDLSRFVIEARPKTRLDAFPLLVMTQHVLKRLADKDLSIISARIAELEALLQAVEEERDRLRGEADEREKKLKNHRAAGAIGGALRSMQGASFKNAKNSAAELEAAMNATQAEKEAMIEKLQQFDAMQAELERLRAENLKQVERLKGQMSILQKQHDQQVKELDGLKSSKSKPSDVAKSWSDADRQSVLLTVLLPDQKLLQQCTVASMMAALPKAGTGSKKDVFDFLFKELANSGAEGDSIDIAASIFKKTRHAQLLDVIKGRLISLTNKGGDHAAAAQKEYDDLMNSLTDITVPGINGFKPGLNKDEAQNMSLMDLLCQTLGVSPEEAMQRLRDEYLASLAGSRVDAEAQTEAVEEEKPAEAAADHDGEKSHKKVQKKKAVPRGGLYSKGEGGKQMAVENVLRLVNEAYEVKIIADVKDDAAGRARQPFTSFLQSFLVRKYGLKSIAKKHLGEIYNSVLKNQAQLPRIRVFGLIAGMLEAETWTQNLCDFALDLLHKICDLDGRAPNNISEWLTADKEPGVTSEAAVLAFTELSAMTKLCPIPASQATLARVAALPKNEAGNIIVYGILAFAIKYHRNADDAVRQGFWALFLENDQNGDGVLSLDEFGDMIKSVSDMNDEREICSMYEECGSLEVDDDDPDTITKESFAELALKYHFQCPPKYLEGIEIMEGDTTGDDDARPP